MILNCKINMKHFKTVEYEDDCLTKIMILNCKMNMKHFKTVEYEDDC